MEKKQSVKTGKTTAKAAKVVEPEVEEKSSRVPELDEVFAGQHRKAVVKRADEVAGAVLRIKELEAQINGLREIIAPALEFLRGRCEYAEVKSFAYRGLRYTVYAAGERWTVNKQRLVAAGVDPEVIRSCSTRSEVPGSMRVVVVGEKEV